MFFSKLFQGFYTATTCFVWEKKEFFLTNKDLSKNNLCNLSLFYEAFCAELIN